MINKEIKIITDERYQSKYKFKNYFIKRHEKKILIEKNLENK
jgi:hypothetical protein